MERRQLGYYKIGEPARGVRKKSRDGFELNRYMARKVGNTIKRCFLWVVGVEINWVLVGVRMSVGTEWVTGLRE